ncbi:MazG nucleotide pyrophosphohydrolase domain-containing protein [Frigoribacterium salinisoli]
MTTAADEAGEALARLVVVVDQLLADEGGCAWNRAQDHQSLVTYLVEEASELVEALEDGTAADVREELGDVLYQVVLHAAVAARAQGAGGPGSGTTLAAVVDEVREKTVRRHPHVFGDARAASLDDIVDVWSAAKAVEKAARQSAYDGVARTMPALARAQKLEARRRAARDAASGAAGDARLREPSPPRPGGALSAAADEREWGRLLLAEVDAVEARGFDVERALRSAVREREEVLRAEERVRADARQRGEQQA